MLGQTQILGKSQARVIYCQHANQSPPTKLAVLVHPPSTTQRQVNSDYLTNPNYLLRYTDMSRFRQPVGPETEAVTKARTKIPQFNELSNKLESERMKSPGFLYSNSRKAMMIPTRPPVTANKARGTGSSAIYNPATGQL